MAPSEHHGDFSTFVEANGQVAFLSVIVLLALKGDDFAVPDGLGTTKVNTMLLYIGFILGRIPFKVHNMNIQSVYTKSRLTQKKRLNYP